MNESERNASGPIVWAAIIGATCLLLALFQKILWLVVPLLLGLIVYYILHPPLRYLVYRGMRQDTAAGIAIAAFIGVLTGVGLLMAPWITAHIVDWQASLETYVGAGLALLERSLAALEARVGLLAEANFTATAMAKLKHGAGNTVQYLEPVAMGVAAWTPSLLLAPFLAYFFLRDGRRFNRFLTRAVPNAFFEKTLYLMNEVDRTLRAYFIGLMKLTVLDTATLAFGLWLLGFPGAFALGLICAVLAWIPYVGSILGGLLVVLVAAADFSDAPTMAYWAIALFVVARLLDDFVYMPLTIGRSLHMHPLVTVLMIFAGGAVAGISGLILVLPLLGVVMVIGETIGAVVTDPHLMARHRHARELRRCAASVDLRV